MLVAGTALFVALSGAAYAGVTLSNNSVRSNHIANGQVKTADLANAAVTTAKLRNGAVNSANVKDGSVELADLSAATQTALGGATGAAGGDLSGTFPNPQIAADAVGSAEIAADAVGGGEIAAGAVGTTELAANEPWHVIGTAGQPAFGNGGWANSPLGVIPLSARFTKDLTGTVHLAGQITGGTIGCVTGSNIVFVLPAGYRPTADRFFGTVSTNGANVITPASVFVTAGGEVHICAGNTTYVSLDGITFLP